MLHRRILAASLALGLLLAAPIQSFAQVNVVPQVGVVTGYVYKQTFRAVSIALTLAATPTDYFCISGSSSKTIRINTVEVAGTITTAVNIPLVLVKRAALDTGGTAASTTANPANTITKLNSTFAASTATLIAYTANPTINDSSPGYIWSTFLPLAAATGNGNRVYLNFNDDNGGLTSPPTIPSGQTAQQICLNGQSTAATLTGNSLNITIEWTEE